MVPAVIEWTGERLVPWVDDATVLYEHLHRYMWAARLANGATRVLDLGCGEGYGSALLAEASASVVGLDLDLPTLHHARTTYSAHGLQLLRSRASTLPFRSASFAVVVCFEVVEHLLEQAQLVEEIARVLTDDGLLLLSTPDRRIYTERDGERNPFHLRELDRAELDELLRPHFPYRQLLRQQVLPSSALLPAAATRWEVAAIEQREGRMIPASTDDLVARYLVAVASRAALGDRAGSLLLDLSASRFRSDSERLVRVQRELDSSTQRLSQQQAEAADWDRRHRRERDQLTERLRALEIDFHDLERRHHELEQTRLDLVASYRDLERRHHELEQARLDLVATYRDLERRHHELEQTRLDLVATYRDLERGHHELARGRDTIALAHQELSSRHRALEQSHAEVLARQQEVEPLVGSLLGRVALSLMRWWAKRPSR